MAKAELGLKRTCVACGARFYDLGRSPAVCPKCGTDQPAEQPRAKRVAAPLPEEKPRKRAAVEGADTDDVEVEDTEADDVADAEDLDEDEDIAEEIGVESDGDEET